MKLIDNFLNSITMYRLVLYFLIVLAGVSLIYSMFGVLPFSFIELLFSYTFLLVVCYVANKVFAYVYEAQVNTESFWITALILGLIINPPKNLAEVAVLGWAGTLAMAAKYIFAIGKKHIFNPVAIAVFLTATFINGSATWWVGSPSMLPVVTIGSFLVIRKIKRWDLVLSFLGTSLLVILAAGLISGSDIWHHLTNAILDLPLIFFAGIMLTEPLTTPPTRNLRIWYGAIVGFLISPQIHLGPLFTTPEIALIIGNIYSYLVSPKYKLILKLKEKIRLSHDVYDFVFTPEQPIKFIPGQYMEWTLEHPKADDRGNRRYLSLSSSPTERDIRIGVKFADPPSSYKRSLFGMTPDQKIVASQLIGDFTLPKDPAQKLVFIAGGIGITPFRSMIKYLIDTNQKRNITVFYVAKNPDDFVYKDVLEEARTKLGIKTIYQASSINGRLTPEEIAKTLPDYRERIYYLSGSHIMVEGFEQVLKNLGAPKNQIITDYFPGFA